MNAAFHPLTSTSAEACSTPINGASTSLKRSGWSSLTADNERNTKRQNSGHSGSVLKCQRTPSSSLTTNNGNLFTRSDRDTSSTECDNSQELQEDMNENDFVAQRNLAMVQDESPGETEVKVTPEGFLRLFEKLLLKWKLISCYLPLGRVLQVYVGTLCYNNFEHNTIA